VDGLVPLLQAAGLPHRLPVLRGHGTRYEDLEGVTARDWYADAEAALLELAKECDKVVVVGLSMGGLVALQLAMEHPDVVGGVATLAAALRFRDPLSAAVPLLARVFRSWPSPESFNDPALKATCENYPRFMTSAFASLLAYAHEMERRLPEVRAPLCVLQSKADTVVDPVAANILYRDVSSEHREIHWFQRSGHEMGQDLERAEVFRTVMDFVGRLRAGAPVQAHAG
jgi:carboxylesterase